ncbi:hypothetical protein PPYR_15359 [Photinus pyralis]|uniref:Palmitoyltransferase n=1 Tax=Photinus pyralis TaxID=7054 RepID=A0A1Y1K8V9_PHOPY|nr:palmitoyltransferase ZDHHC6 [Photinus pyralis]KAB0790303.1 hypothetical protein PPYR_15359 [Photinus pyralis]
MCFGPFSRICHWGPLTALGIIKLITGVTLYCGSMWWPSTTWGGFFNTSFFMGMSGLTLYNFMSSMFHGPGYLPLLWRPVNEKECENLQWCGVCQGYKAPRSHHCRKCGRCVMKMDHHCPWINNCVGWGNHAHFTAFLFFAVVGCGHSSTILSFSLYRGINRTWYMYHNIQNVPIVHFGLYGLILTVFGLGLAVGVVLAVGMLLGLQLRAIIRNRTGIEDWILEKAIYRRKDTDDTFVFPYHLGLWRNVRQVLNVGCEPVGDGILWEVAEGCDQFTLTKEQLAQKTDKRHRTKLYNILYPASGAWFPITKGLRVFLSIPCTDEPRIKLKQGDVVIVSRWRKHWLFGEKIQAQLDASEQSIARVRGWFPRKCAVELVDSSSTNSQLNFQDKKLK